MQAAEAGFLPPGQGRSSGVGAAMAGQTRLKVGNKPQKHFILQFLNLRAKERNQGFS